MAVSWEWLPGAASAVVRADLDVNLWTTPRTLFAAVECGCFVGAGGACSSDSAGASACGACGAGWKSGNLTTLEFCPFGIEIEKQGFQTAWDITGKKFQGLGLKLKAFILTFRDLDYVKNHGSGWLVYLTCLSFARN